MNLYSEQQIRVLGIDWRAGIFTGGRTHVEEPGSLAGSNGPSLTLLTILLGQAVSYRASPAQSSFPPVVEGGSLPPVEVGEEEQEERNSQEEESVWRRGG